MSRCGKRVKECREAAGYTQPELAEAIEALPENNGKTRSDKHISAVERGERRLSIEYARLISKVLKVDEDYLLCKSDHKTFQDWLGAIREEDEKMTKSVLYMLKVFGISISEYFRKELVGEELQDYIKQYEAIGLIPTNPHKNIAIVKIDKDDPIEVDANEIYDFVETIIEFVEFQSQKIRKWLNEDKPLDSIYGHVPYNN